MKKNKKVNESEIEENKSTPNELLCSDCGIYPIYKDDLCDECYNIYNIGWI